MPREKELYRDNLERVCERFKSEMIPLKDAADFIGCDVRTLQSDRDFPVKKLGRKYYVSSVALARWLS